MISIIIPAYNAANDIERCVDSIVNQSYSDIEIIIVNDGSKDNTGDIIDRLAARHSFIKAIHTPNQGAFMARLTGVRKASGEWISFADSDDTLTPDGLTELSRHINPFSDIIVGTININNTRIFRHQVSGNLTADKYIEALLSSKTSIGPYAKLYQKRLFSSIPLHRERISVNEDLLMLLYLAANARSIYISADTVFYNYIFQKNSMRSSAMPIERWTLLFHLIEQIIKPFDDINLDKALYRLKLLRIKNQMINYGLYITPEHELYHEVIDSPYLESLSKKDLKIIRTIKSPVRQRLSRKKYQCYTICRDIYHKFK